MRKFLVVVDDSPEMLKALHFAARRAEHTDGELVLLYINDAPEYSHWLGVEAIIQEEREEIAIARLQEVAVKAKKITGKDPEMIVREGEKPQTLMKLLDEDKSISIVVLGANTDPENQGKDGPGPILTYLMGRNASNLTHPITVIPSNLTFEEIDLIA